MKSIFDLYARKREKSGAIKDVFEIYARLKAAEANLARSRDSDLFTRSPYLAFKLLVSSVG